MGVACGETPAAPGYPHDTFWAILEPAERVMLRQAGTLRRFAAGYVICRQGETQRHVLVLLTGRVEIMADARDGYEAVLAIRGAGNIVGELAAVDGRPRSATVRAVDDVEAIVIPSDRFVALCQRRPMLTWAVLRIVVGRVRELSQQRAEDSGATVAERLAVLLVELAEQHGAPTTQGVTIMLPFAQRELAGMVGGSRESVVRALRDLRVQGLITTARRNVTILRLDALRALTS